MWPQLQSLFRCRCGYAITQTLRRDSVVGKGPGGPAAAVTEISVNRPQHVVVSRLRALEQEGTMSLEEWEK